MKALIKSIVAVSPLVAVVSLVVAAATAGAALISHNAVASYVDLAACGVAIVALALTNDRELFETAVLQETEAPLIAGHIHTDERQLAA